MGGEELKSYPEVWIAQFFKDGTVQTIHTSFNAEVLASRGIELKENYFFDLDRLRYVAFREDAISVECYTEPPRFSEEVNVFAFRFI